VGEQSVTKDFENIDISEILNYEYANTAVMARYERIMQHRTIEAMNGLSGRLDSVVNKLVGVMETIHRVGQLAQEKANQAILAAGNARQAQGRQQRAMYVLTAALVLCTLAYTGINYWVAVEMREGNEIQRLIANAAKEQAAAARESNEIQKHLPIPLSIDLTSRKDSKANHGKTGHTQ
jgi:hypothetical protein